MAPPDLCVAAQPLYNYLRGANDKQLQLDMAKPAIIDIRPNKDFSSTGTNYTVLFYLPDLSEVGTLVGTQPAQKKRCTAACHAQMYGEWVKALEADP